MKNAARRFAPLVAFLFTTIASAAPPEVKSLFPAGGEQGTTVEAAIGGRLDKADRFWCSCDGVTAEPADDAKTIRITIAPETAAGLCWLRAYNDDGASSLRPFVIGTLPEVAESEPNDADAARPLDSSRLVVNGVLSKAGDVDTFAVPLTAGETLVASMTANRTLGSPMDAVLQLLSPDGFVLEQNDDDRGFDPQLVYTAQTDGTYFVRTFAFPATPNSSIRFAGGADYVYRLTLTNGPFADHVFPLAVTRGESATVKPGGWNLTDAVREIPVAGDPAAPTATVSHPLLGNTVELAQTPLRSIVEDEAARAGDAQPLDLPVSVSGCIGRPGERDAYRFEAKKGDKLAVRVTARELDSPLDAVLQIIGPDGKTIREIDDADRSRRDPQFDLQAPADGEYRVEIRDLHERGGFRFVYRLDVQPETPGFSLQTEKDSFRAEGAGPLGIPVKIERTAGFADEIALSVEGLPEKVTVAPAKSEPKGDTAKAVKLSLTAPAELRWSGPIRIVGRASNGAVESATAPISGLDARTRDLWLTLAGSAAAEE